MKKKINFKSIIRNIIIFLVIAIIGFVLGQKYISDDKWVEVDSQSISISSNHTAIVVTDDVVYTTLNAGYLENKEEEGKRIKKGQVIGTFVVTAANNPDNAGQNLQDDNLLYADTVEVDKNKIKLNADKLYEDMKRELKNGNNFEAKKLKRELEYTIEHLNRLNNHTFVQKSEFEENKKTIGSSSASPEQKFTIISSDAGILSYYVDNLSGKLRFEDRHRIDYDRLFNTSNIIVNRSGEKIKQNEKVLKIILDKKWYLLCQSTLDDLDRYKIDDKLNLYINNEEFDSVVVDKFMSKNTGIICLEIQKLSEKIAASRLLNVSLVSKEVTGVLIPQESIVRKDGVKGVYVRGIDGEELFRPIQILGTSNDNIVVSENSYIYKDENGELNTVDTVSRKDKVLVKGK